MNTHEDETCMRCGKKLDHSKSVWLELNSVTNRYSKGGVPEDESQGCFEFGADCATAILKNGGELMRIGKAVA